MSETIQSETIKKPDVCPSCGRKDVVLLVSIRHDENWDHIEIGNWYCEDCKWESKTFDTDGTEED